MQQAAESVSDQEFSDNVTEILEGQVPNHNDDDFHDSAASNEDSKPTLEEKLNDQDIDKLVKVGLEAVNEIKDLEAQAKQINSKKAEIRDRLETMGINRHALALTVKISKMNDDQLDGYDLSTMILRKAIGNPIQSDLFDK